MRPKDLPLTSLAVLALSWVLLGCGAESTAQINTFVSGRLAVSADVDSVADFSGFEIAVVSNLDGDIDTLGVTTSDSAGDFAMTVRVPERGIYPLAISRAGTSLGIEEIVLAEFDSVRVTGTFPLNGRPLRIVSKENAAWTAYKNTKAQHNRMMLSLAQSNPDYTPAEMGQIVGQTSTIFWGLQETFPETFGSLVASAESVIMLEGWADSVAVARAETIVGDHPSRIQIIRALRPSVARLSGQRAAVTYLRQHMTGDDPEDDAALLAEVVVAHMDSLEQVQAVQAAREIQQRFSQTGWSTWAEGAIYEVEHLLPGMPAPAFSLIDVDGEVLDNQVFQDQFYMLEFYTPTHPHFQRELRLRQSILNALDDDIFEAISISIDPDSAYNEALLDGRNFQGRFVFAPEGRQSLVATAYNVNVIPTRVLVDPAGRIVKKYVGPTLEDLETDLARLLLPPGAR